MAGIPNSRAMIATWQVRPPWLVMMAPAFFLWPAGWMLKKILSKLTKHEEQPSCHSHFKALKKEMIIFKLQFFHILHLKIHEKNTWDLFKLSKCHNRLPIRIGHISHQHLTFFKLVHLIDACQDVHLRTGFQELISKTSNGKVMIHEQTVHEVYIAILQVPGMFDRIAWGMFRFFLLHVQRCPP